MFLGRGYSHDSITAAMPFHASRTPEEHALCMLLQCFETPEDLVKSELLECRSQKAQASHNAGPVRATKGTRTALARRLCDPAVQPT